MVESQRDSQLQQIEKDFGQLQQAIAAQQETLEEMEKALEQDGDEIEDLRERVRTLETKLEEVEKKLSTFKVDDCVLALTFVANIFEIAICWHVMPEFYTGDKLTSRIQDLHDYVNGIKEIDDWGLGIMEKPSCKQRWEDVREKLGWKFKWERDKPPHDLKVLEMIASLSNGRKFVSSSPIEISEAIEKTTDLKGLPSIKTKAIVDFLVEVPAKLACCGLNYEDQ